MVKINASLLPIKAHYFFFMAAMGPILPQINVFAKELGIPADVMGFVTSILPFLYILAKPVVGYLIDYFTNLRKFIFSLIVLLMTLCYAGLYFVPNVPYHEIPIQNTYNFTQNNIYSYIDYNNDNINTLLCTDYRMVNCHILCPNIGKNYGLFEAVLQPSNVTLSVIDQRDETTESVANISYVAYLTAPNTNTSQILNETNCNFSCQINTDKLPDCVTNTITFWTFVLLMSVGTIGFNVANCVSDATCFDMLGNTQAMKYGNQRVWGTIGFGVAALIGGIAVNAHESTNIGPGLLVMLFFCIFDLVSIQWLKLPSLTGSESIVKDVYKLLSQKPIMVFLVFATLAGIIDAFIIYYMFWHLEEIAATSNSLHSIKLVEGCVVAAECLGGEILFFLISGKILRKIGYVHCLSFCFFMYSIRLMLISLITNPWYLVLVELFMQGPTYALCYTCIVAYASAVSPPGTTATVQGLVAGMDDGVGFAIGSFIGGQMYKRLGGAQSFRYFSIGALIVCGLHIILRPAKSHEINRPERERDEYALPEEQLKLEK